MQESFGQQIKGGVSTSSGQWRCTVLGEQFAAVVVSVERMRQSVVYIKRGSV